MRNLAARAAMMAKTDICPYQKVEYIGANGNYECVDTGYLVSSTSEIELALRDAYSGGSCCCFGARKTFQWDATQFTPSIWVNGSGKPAYNDCPRIDSGWITTAPSSTDVVYKLKVESSTIKRLYANDSLIYTVENYSSYTPIVTAGIFSCHGPNNTWMGIDFDAGLVSRKNYSKFLYAKIWEDSVMTAYLIPVRIGQVGYVYDLIRKELHGNAGRGTLLVGGDVSAYNGGGIS